MAFGEKMSSEREGWMVFPFDGAINNKKKPILSKFVELGNLLQGLKDLKEIAEESLKMVLRLFKLDTGRIYLLDNISKNLVLIAHQGLEDVQGLERIPLGSGFTGKAVETRSFVAHPVDVLEDKDRVGLLRSKGLKYIYCVPFVVRGSVEGAMNLGSKKGRVLSVRDMETLMVMGHQIGIAIGHARLYSDLSEKIKSLKERKETIKFFAYSVSHDLKSPTVGLYGLARRLLERYGDVLDEKGRSYCLQIMKAGEEIVNMVECINSYINARETIEDPQYFNFEDIVKSIKSEFKQRFNSREIQVILQKEWPEVYGYPHLVLRAMRNLVDNALKHGGSILSQIEISIKENEKFWIIAVRDNGTGIPSNKVGVIFEPFVRGDARMEGSGLGLAIISEIAKKHGGKAWVESSVEARNTIFYLSIKKPLSEKDNDVCSL